MRFASKRGWTFALVLVGTIVGTRLATAAVTFRVVMPPDAVAAENPGRLYLFLSQRGEKEPRFGPDWFNPEPFFGLDVAAPGLGDSIVVDDAADSFPAPLSKLPAGEYRAQALLATNPDVQEHAKGPGNRYSDIYEINVRRGRDEVIELELLHTVEEPAPLDHPRIREIKLRSELLSKFHGRDVYERAAVVLPEGYDTETDRHYPVVYAIPGFSGSERDARRYLPFVDAGGEPLILVALSGQCQWGHHVYADSATNGPRGQALVAELIPHIDHEFRTFAETGARFVMGHSSGGWSSLWLQVEYPDTFGGVWSTSPDPVDFRDYQQIDLYARPPQNMYVDSKRQRRPIARRGETPIVWYDDFSRMDDVIGRGGQLRSFEAVFSPLDEQGLPRKLWNRQTGTIDPVTAEAWKPYDIRLKLEREWPENGPELQGKLNIITGELDTFYLQGAVEKLKPALAQLGSDAVVEIIPQKDHSNLLTQGMLLRIRGEMMERFRASEAASAP
ncbi:MAG: alpha/beta hydrolase-fold protein [Planctomycetia bacterium]|nr:alpha/beta hydrolase-fold protein [Planctomycetia bacterium]